MNTLMTDVLGYKAYAAHGTDWGCSVAYHLYSSYNSTVRAAQLVFLPFFPYTTDQLSDAGIALDELEQFEEGSFMEWYTNGQGYFLEQTTKESIPSICLEGKPRIDTRSSPTPLDWPYTTTQLVSSPGLAKSFSTVSSVGMHVVHAS